MKKTYIAPAIQEMEVEFESTLMTVSSSDLGDTSWGGQTGSNIGNGPQEADSNKKRRGSWGNLWE